MRPLFGLTQYLHDSTLVVVNKQGVSKAVLFGGGGFDLVFVSYAFLQT